jgi:hypothetical protein
MEYYFGLSRRSAVACIKFYAHSNKSIMLFDESYVSRYVDNREGSDVDQSKVVLTINTKI